MDCHQERDMPEAKYFTFSKYYVTIVQKIHEGCCIFRFRSSYFVFLSFSSFHLLLFFLPCMRCDVFFQFYQNEQVFYSLLNSIYSEDYRQRIVHENRASKKGRRNEKKIYQNICIYKFTCEIIFSMFVCVCQYLVYLTRCFFLQKYKNLFMQKKRKDALLMFS